jgi:ABC-type Mn2+/Zn2+ transport system permease subunit
MVSFLLEPLANGFMQRGLAAGLLVAIVCGLLGCFVVLRGMEYIGDAISHSVLPGVVIAYIAQGNLFLGGLVSALVTAGIISALSREGKLRDSTAIGVVFTAALALGVLLISTARSYARDLSHFLFGNILGVTEGDLVFTALLVVFVGAAVFLFFKELLVTSFDPTHARKIGIPVNALRTGLLITLALTIVAGAQTVGVLMVTALLITPAASASLLTKRLPRMIVYATAFAVASVFVGLYASYYLEVASGAAIVLSASLIFAVAWIVNWARQRRTALPAL